MSRRDGIVFVAVGVLLVVFGALGWRTVFGTLLAIAGVVIVRRTAPDEAEQDDDADRDDGDRVGDA